jgi:hypothetical protein
VRLGRGNQLFARRRSSRADKTTIKRLAAKASEIADCPPVKASPETIAVVVVVVLVVAAVVVVVAAVVVVVVAAVVVVVAAAVVVVVAAAVVVVVVVAVVVVVVAAFTVRVKFWAAAVPMPLAAWNVIG